MAARQDQLGLDVRSASSAVLSPCGQYRYRLDRDVQAAGLVFAYFGVNPSTADADLDDATVRKWRGFTRLNGGSRFIAGNVFSFRATDVKTLKDCPALQGPEHDRYINEIVAEADVLVPCWGRTQKLPPELRHECAAMMEMLLAAGKPVLHFGTTKDGDPKHPQMLGYDTQLVPWPST